MTNNEKLIIEIQKDLSETQKFLAKTYKILGHPRKSVWAGRKAEILANQINQNVTTDTEKNADRTKV